MKALLTFNSNIFKGWTKADQMYCNLEYKYFLLTLDFNIRHVLNVVCFLLGNSPVSEFCVPVFRNTLSVPSS